MRFLGPTILACAIFSAPVHAEGFEWGKVIIPVTDADWRQLPQDGQIGYIMGALQADAYLNADDAGVIGCITTFIEPILTETMAPGFEGHIALTVMERTITACGANSQGSGKLLSSNELSEFITTKDDTGDLWTGFIIGMSDFVHFQTYAKFGTEMADCVHDEALDYINIDLNAPESWTRTPDDPFIEDLVIFSLNQCDES